MNFYVFIPLVAFFINIVLTTYVYAQNSRSPVNRAFVWLSSLFAFWVAFDVVIWSPIEPAWIVPLMRMQAVVYNFVGIAFIHFAYAFTQRKIDSAYRFFLFMPFLAALVIVGSDLIVSGSKAVFWGNVIEGGPLYLPFATINGAIPITYSVALLVRTLLASRNPIERKQLAYFMTGTVGGLSIGFPSFVVLPHLLQNDSLPIHHAGLIGFLLAVFIAITRYRFLAIGISDVAQDLFSNTRDGVVILDTGNRVIQYNEKAGHLVDGQTDRGFARRIAELSGRYGDNPDLDGIDVQLRSAPTPQYASISCAPIHQSDKQIGKLLFIRDTTQQKSAEAAVMASNRDLARTRDEALQASRTKSAFLANMSHELRTPLNAIIGYSEMLEEEAVCIGNRQIASDLRRIHGAGHHLLGLINNILDLSKIEAGKMELYIEEFNIAAAVNTVESQLRQEVGKNNNVLIVHCPADIGTIRADQMRLKQILSNLLSNALKFTENGTVQLEVARENPREAGMLLFRISDNGIGMNREQRSGLFRYFSQADPTVTRKYGGTGLGLAISLHFCQMMGGEIAVESEPGKGSTFTVRLPGNVHA